jgi:hypothetical protein
MAASSCGYAPRPLNLRQTSFHLATFILILLVAARRSALQPRGRPFRDLLIRPRAFVGCKRSSGRLFAGRDAEIALIVT